MSDFADMVAVVPGGPLLAFGLIVVLGLSVLAGLFIGSVLGHISRKISLLLDAAPVGDLEAGHCRWTLRVSSAVSESATAQRANRV